MEQSFSIQGPKLFNLLPKHLRDLKGVSLDIFKKGLDSFLSQIPDEPQLAGYTAIRKTDSNSLVDMIKIVSFSRDRHPSVNP